MLPTDFAEAIIGDGYAKCAHSVLSYLIVIAKPLRLQRSRKEEQKICL